MRGHNTKTSEAQDTAVSLLFVRGLGWRKQRLWRCNVMIVKRRQATHATPCPPRLQIAGAGKRAAA